MKELDLVTRGLVDPQKWAFAELAVKDVIERLLELKRDLVDLNIETNAIRSDFFNFEPFLEAMKRPSSDLNLFVPHFFQNNELIQSKEKMLLSKLEQFGDPRPECERLVEMRASPKVAEALAMIIRAEKGRQGLAEGVTRKIALLELQQKQQRQKHIAERGEAEEKSEIEETMKLI